jgi:hypothetical protein
LILQIKKDWHDKEGSKEEGIKKVRKITKKVERVMGGRKEDMQARKMNKVRKM